MTPIPLDSIATEIAKLMVSYPVTCSLRQNLEITKRELVERYEREAIQCRWN